MTLKETIVNEFNYLKCHLSSSTYSLSTIQLKTHGLSPPLAGGASKAGLKDAKSKKHKRKAKKEEAESSSPGDLLGDLSAALGRRRKAMSGKDKPREKEERKEDHNLGGGSMMDNISKMIPAPPGKRERTHVSETESRESRDSDDGAW